MVMGVCRRVLPNRCDAEDAFQATFLVFARKAGSVATPNALGGWLYRVAHRAALEARARIARRQATERQVKDMPDPEATTKEDSGELLSALDRELDRLPVRYRVPIVLCELEGRGRKEVARTLGLPEGTLSWRLAHAKKLLARRLARYGAVAPAGALSAVLSRDAASACVPCPLLNATAKAALRLVAGESLAAGLVPSHVLIITEGVLKAMLLNKLKTVWAVALVVALGAGAVGLTYRPAVAQPRSPYPDRPAEKLAPAQKVGRAAPDELEELRLEVAALRKGLEAMRARVKALEERQAPDARRTDPAPNAGRTKRGLFDPAPQPKPLPADEKPGLFDPKPQPRPQRPADEKPGLFDPKHSPPADPLADAEAALKRLRQHPDDRQAADDLQRALRQLRDRQAKDAWEGAVRDAQRQSEKGGADPKKKE
jgi:RNA polymerase sigma factor (sigma-70 family)